MADAEGLTLQVLLITYQSSQVGGMGLEAPYISSNCKSPLTLLNLETEETVGLGPLFRVYFFPGRLESPYKQLNQWPVTLVALTQ